MMASILNKTAQNILHNRAVNTVEENPWLHTHIFNNTADFIDHKRHLCANKELRKFNKQT